MAASPFLAAAAPACTPAACRRFCSGVLAAFFGVYLSLVTATNWLVDPEMEGHPAALSLVERRFYHSLASTKTLFDKLGGAKKYALVFGTSRSHLVSPDILGEDVLNFHALYGNPKSVDDFLGQLGEDQIASISKIYYLLDNATFSDNKSYPHFDYRSRLAPILYSVKTFCADKISEAVKTVYRNRTGRYDYYLDENGYKIDVNEPTFDPKTYTGRSEDVSFKADSMEALAAVDRFARSRGIPIVYYTAPLPDVYLRHIDFEALAALRAAWANRIGGFYELTYLEGVSNDYSNFFDESHLKTAPLKTVFQKILLAEDKSKFVTAASLPARLEQLRRRLKNPGP